jgi:hypothetical protein
MSKFSFPHEIILEGSGFEWIIKFERVDSEGFAYGQMTLKVKTIHQEKKLGCVLFSSSYSDLVALADYFDHHVKRLISDPWSESDVFVQYGLEFQIQALCGEVSPNMEGDFTLRVMLNVEVAIDETAVYVGIESVVDAAKCHAFVTKLRNFLSAWSSLEEDSRPTQSHEVVHAEA